MIYPDNFEKKIGFDEIRTLLKGRCISTLGTEWIDNKLTFMKDFERDGPLSDRRRQQRHRA